MVVGLLDFESPGCGVFAALRSCAHPAERWETGAARSNSGISPNPKLSSSGPEIAN